MSGTARKLQRRGQGSRVRAALVQAQHAVAGLQGMGLDRLPEALRELEAQTTRVVQLADALAEDYETLLEELEVQREVTIRLCSTPASLGTPEWWREWEARVRQQVKDEREQRDAESAITTET
jgi:hypothetical protein